MKWFKHMSDMKEDPKVRRLVKQYGADGKVVYMDILEAISKQLDPRSNIIPVLEQPVEELVEDYGIAPQILVGILDFCVDNGLLERSDFDFIFCFKLYKYVDEYFCKNQKNLEGVYKRNREIVNTYKDHGLQKTLEKIEEYMPELSEVLGRIEIKQGPKRPNMALLQSYSGVTTDQLQPEENRREQIENRYREDIEDFIKEKNTKKENPSPFEKYVPSTSQKIDAAITHWNSIQGLPKTRKLSVNLGEKAKPIIESVKLYSLDEIKTAIDNYAQVISNDQRYKPIAKYGDVFGFLSTGIDKYWDEANPLDLMLIPGSRGIVKSDLTPEEEQAEADALWGNAK
jgi:hypothetical protein